MRVEIELEEDQICDIVRKRMIEDLGYAEDKKTHRAIRTIIKWYSTAGQWEGFKNEHE
jgi:dTDP-D-glucose 4,6-dehydratase